LSLNKEIRFNLCLLPAQLVAFTKAEEVCLTSIIDKKQMTQ
jgi:hypothetical protein